MENFTKATFSMTTLKMFKKNVPNFCGKTEELVLKKKRIFSKINEKFYEGNFF